MRGYRRRRHRAPWSRRQKRCCVLLVCLVLVAGIMLRLDCKLRPAILEIALSDLETVVNNTIDPRSASRMRRTGRSPTASWFSCNTTRTASCKG